MKQPAPGSIWSFRGYLWRVDSVSDRYVFLESMRTGLKSRFPIASWPSEYQPIWPPKPGSVWDYVPPDLIRPWAREPSFQSQVLGVDRKGVRLLDLGVGTTMHVPREAWPSDFLPAYDASKEPPRVYKAVLVGGGKGKHLERLKKFAAEIGIDIEYHIAYKQKFAERNDWYFPSDIDVVLILTSHMSHNLYHRALDRSKSEGTPFIILTSSNFQPQLWEGMRDIFPLDYGMDWFGAPPELRKQIDPGDSTWVWTDDGWVLMRDSDTFLGGDSGSSGDSIIAALLGFAGIAAMYKRRNP